MKNICFRDDVLPLKNKLFRLALRITLDKAEAEDVVQDTMIKVWNRRDNWERIESMEAFCMTICRNIALDKVKAAAKRNVAIDDNISEAPADTSYEANPEEQAVQRDRMDTVKRIMDSLPEKQRSAMHLRDFEAKSYKEIAAILDITEEQVKINIFRARQTIKQKYAKTESYGL